MIKDVIENIVKAEERAKNILNEAEATVRQIELDSEIKIEKLKETAEADLRKEIANLREKECNAEVDEKQSVNSKKLTKEKQTAKTEKAKKYVVTEFLKRIDK